MNWKKEFIDSKCKFLSIETFDSENLIRHFKNDKFESFSIKKGEEGTRGDILIIERFANPNKSVQGILRNLQYFAYLLYRKELKEPKDLFSFSMKDVLIDKKYEIELDSEDEIEEEYW